MSRLIPILSNLDDLAESIADPPPNRPFERAVGEFGRDVCDRLSSTPSDFALNPVVGLMQDVCQPYWDNQGYSAPVSAAPFEGGQCPGSRYTLTGTYVQSCFGTAGQTFTWRSGGGVAIGPIRGIKQTEQGWEVDHAGTATIGVVSNVSNAGVARVPRSGVECSQIGSGEATATETPKITAVTPFGGDSDSCGDPDPTLEPGPTPAPDPGPLPPDTGPTEDPTGSPVFILPPSFGFDPTLEVGIDVGEVNFGGGGSDAPPSPPPGDVGTPGTAVEAGDTDAEGEAPPGSEIVGLKLNLVSALEGSREYGDGIYRGGAYIYFGTAEGLDQDFGGSQITDGQFFFAEREGLTKWRVSANVGYIWSVVPYYREVV